MFSLGMRAHGLSYLSAAPRAQRTSLSQRLAIGRGANFCSRHPYALIDKRNSETHMRARSDALVLDDIKLLPLSRHSDKQTVTAPSSACRTRFRRFVRIFASEHRIVYWPTTYEMRQMRAQGHCR